jgi:hypothetical protein
MSRIELSKFVINIAKIVVGFKGVNATGLGITGDQVKEIDLTEGHLGFFGGLVPVLDRGAALSQATSTSSVLSELLIYI